MPKLGPLVELWGSLPSEVIVRKDGVAVGRMRGQSWSLGIRVVIQRTARIFLSREDPLF